MEEVICYMKNCSIYSVYDTSTKQWQCVENSEFNWQGFSKGMMNQCNEELYKSFRIF